VPSCYSMKSARTRSRSRRSTWGRDNLYVT
jgi:hypothetical protein